MQANLSERIIRLKEFLESCYQWISKDKFETPKNIAQVIALIIVGLFFCFKYFHGYTNLNMGLLLDIERSGTINSLDEDYLAVTINLKKGEVGSVVISGIWVGLLELPIRKTFRTTEIKTNYYVDVHKLVEKGLWSYKKAKEIIISPGEDLSFATYFNVPSNQAFVAEVAVFCRRVSTLHVREQEIQWRASKVSLPLKSKEIENFNKTGHP